MFGPRRVVNLPPRFTPVRRSFRQFDTDIIVPVVHPSHTTNIHRQNWKYFHSYPHTESNVFCRTCQEFHCPPTHHRC